MQEEFDLIVAKYGRIPSDVLSCLEKLSEARKRLEEAKKQLEVVQGKCSYAEDMVIGTLDMIHASTRSNRPEDVECAELFTRQLPGEQEDLRRAKEIVADAEIDLRYREHRVLRCERNLNYAKARVVELEADGKRLFRD